MCSVEKLHSTSILSLQISMLRLVDFYEYGYLDYWVCIELV
jgi:hypothetical protein